MKKVIFGIMAFFLPLMMVIALYRHTTLQYNPNTHHYTDTIHTREFMDYFIHSYDDDTQRLTNMFETIKNQFTKDKWNYESYVPYEFINLAESDTPLKDFFNNFVQFFKMVANFFANAAMYFVNIGYVLYNAWGIVFNVGWMVFTLIFKILGFGLYLLGYPVGS